MEKVLLSAPFAKTIPTEEGGRELYGWATLEVVDKSGEIADFEGTVKAFEKWSNDTAKRTGGRNLGPVRLMHQPIAVGKTISWKPSETTITDEDGNEKTVKGIWVGAYVPPTKPDVIRDIDEGILSAFSIGGSYEKRWWDDGAQAFRYIPQLSEYSLVDNPCVGGANVEQVIAKAADAPWNRKEGADMSEELSKDVAPKGGENTMTKGEKNMDIESVLKNYNISQEQLVNLLKALTPQDAPPAPVDAKTVDGDGDKDDNKEFPAPNDDAVNQGAAESEVKDAEEEVGVAEKAAEAEVAKADVITDDDQPNDETCPNCGEPMDKCSCGKAEKSAPTGQLLDILNGKHDLPLEKAGKAISNKNGVHLQHAANHIDAVMKGADYTHDDHLVVESQYGQGLTGEEAPEVDVEKVFSAIFTPIIEATVSKTLNAEAEKFQKAANNTNTLETSIGGLQEMVKAVSKSQEEMKKFLKKMDSLEKMVKEIHETPQAGGPLLNGGNPAFVMKSFNQMDMAQAEESTLEKFVGEIKDPILRDKVGQELAMRKMRQALR